MKRQTRGIKRVLAVLESSMLIRPISSLGRLLGHLRARRIVCLCSSFDWFCGQDLQVVAGEKNIAARRFMAYVTMAILYHWLRLYH